MNAAKIFDSNSVEKETRSHYEGLYGDDSTNIHLGHRERIPPPGFHALLQRLVEDLQRVRRFKNIVQQRRITRVASLNECERIARPTDLTNGDENAKELIQELREMGLIFTELNGWNRSDDIKWLYAKSRQDTNLSLNKNNDKEEQNGDDQRQCNISDNMIGISNIGTLEIGTLEIGTSENGTLMHCGDVLNHDERKIEYRGWKEESLWAAKCFDLLEIVFNELHGILAGKRLG